MKKDKSVFVICLIAVIMILCAWSFAVFFPQALEEGSEALTLFQSIQNDSRWANTLGAQKANREQIFGNMVHDPVTGSANISVAYFTREILEKIPEGHIGVLWHTKDGKIILTTQKEDSKWEQIIFDPSEFSLEDPPDPHN